MPRITHEYLQSVPYGADLLREIDLVLAANLLASMERSETLYDEEITHRVSHFCRSLDAGCDPKFLGVIDVPDIPGETRHATFKRLKDELATYPRGHWAIYRQDEAYDAWISNGVGGTDTRSGNKFIYNSPDAPSLTFENVYATVFSHIAYHRRYAIRDEILAETVNSAGLTPGRRWKNISYSGKNWSNVVYLEQRFSESQKAPIHIFRLSRRGAKAEERALDNSAIFHMLKLTPVIPAHYRDPENASRLRSLYERRRDRAQTLWDQMIDPDLNILDRMRVVREFSRADATEFSKYASKAEFRQDGDQLSRTAYVGDREQTELPTYTYTATFEPGSDRIVSATIIHNES